MENKAAIHAYLLNAYNELAYTHSYIFGYTMGGMVYAAKVMDARNILPFLTYTDCASSKNGGTVSVKYRQNTARIGIINSAACEIRPVCSVEYLENKKQSGSHNRGQIFEEMVAKVFKMTRNTSKNADFTSAGDVWDANGIHYQVKFNKASFTDERTIHNLLARG